MTLDDAILASVQGQRWTLTQHVIHAAVVRTGLPVGVVTDRVIELHRSGVLASRVPNVMYRLRRGPAYAHRPQKETDEQLSF